MLSDTQWVPELDAMHSEVRPDVHLVAGSALPTSTHPFPPPGSSR